MMADQVSPLVCPLFCSSNTERKKDKKYICKNRRKGIKKQILILNINQAFEVAGHIMPAWSCM